jgi:hypothetical protein
MNKNKPLNLLNTADLNKASISCSKNKCEDMWNAVNEAIETKNVAALDNACKDPSFPLEYNLNLKHKHGDIPLCENDTKKTQEVKSILNNVREQVAESKSKYSTNSLGDKNATVSDSKDFKSTIPFIDDSTIPVIADSKSTIPDIADSKSTNHTIADSKSTSRVVADSKSTGNKTNVSTDADNIKRIASNVTIFKGISQRYPDNKDKLLVCVLYFMNECFYEKEKSIRTNPYKISDLPEYNPNIGAGVQYFKWYVDFFNNVNKFGDFIYDYNKFKPLLNEIYQNKEKDIIISIRNEYFETDILKKELVLTEVFKLMNFAHVWKKISNKPDFMNQINNFWSKTFGNDINIKQFIENHKDTFEGGKRIIKSNKNKNRTKKNTKRSNRKSRRSKKNRRTRRKL